MVDQTYLPSKTITLKEDDLNISRTPSSAAKTNIPSKVNYSSEKTINIVDVIAAEKKEEKAKEVQPDTLIKTPPPITNVAIKDNYSSEKTITIVDAVTSEKKEDKPKEAPVNSAIKPPAPLTNVAIKDNYPSEKTISIVGDLATEKKEEKPKEAQPDTIIKTPPPITNVAIKDNYSSLKTINIVDVMASEKKEEKPKEAPVKTVIKPPAPLTNVAIKDNYSSEKTVNIVDEKNVPKNEEKPLESILSIDIKSTIIKDEKIIIQSLTSETNLSKESENHLSYSEHKTIIISKVEVSPNVPEIDKQQEIKNVQTINVRREEKENYPSSKTITISEEEKIPAKKDLEYKPISPMDNKAESTTSGKTEEPVLENYPDNKSHTFAKEEIKIPGVNDVAYIRDKKTGIEVKKVEIEVKKNSKPRPESGSGKSKKPVLWMVLSIVFFIASSFTVWLMYNQQNSFHKEIYLLKQNKADLTDSIKKLQKNKLHFDDLITRAGKIDSQNKITVVDAAIESEAIRICFSINSNLYALKGNKAVYIRFITPDKNVLMKTKDNVFEYRGNQIPYSLKEEVDYKNKEMMLCFDYKIDEKLQKGIYKAEIYNDGVLDGMGTFELK